MAGNPDFDLYQSPEEHDELRAAIRALSEKEIAPYAKEVDEDSRFPEEALKALNASGFNAIHVPEEYDGQGADSVAACIVIEEVARVCGSSSLIPAVNKLGTMGLILKGSEELKKQVLPSLAGGAMASSSPGAVERRYCAAVRFTLSSCVVCLGDYEQGEELKVTSSPGQQHLPPLRTPSPPQRCPPRSFRSVRACSHAWLARMPPWLANARPTF